MNKHIKWWGLLAITSVFFFQACVDFAEPDLSDEQVNLVTPIDDYRSESQVVGFFWELQENILDYRLQVVSPSFEFPQYYALDTLLNSDQFEAILSAGSYEWRVIGSNNFSVTANNTRSFTVENDTTLTNKYLQLLSPADQALLSNETVALLWEAIPEAEAYRVQVAAPNFQNSSYIVYDELLSTDNFTATLPDGSYLWRVRVENTDAESPYNQSSFVVDTEGPAAALLSSPADSDTLASPVTLVWDAAPDAVLDSVYIYSDNLVSLVEKSASSTGTYDFGAGNSGNSYVWRVRSKDAAGNVGVYSASRKFVVE